MSPTGQQLFLYTVNAITVVAVSLNIYFVYQNWQITRRRRAALADLNAEVAHLKRCLAEAQADLERQRLAQEALMQGHTTNHLRQ